MNKNKIKNWIKIKNDDQEKKIREKKIQFFKFSSVKKKIGKKVEENAKEK